MRVVIGTDHRGFALKEELKKRLTDAGYEVEDVGAHSLDRDDDYPDFAYAAALKIAQDPSALSVLLCGSGMGMDIVANKVKGVRSTVGYSRSAASHARSNDNVNILTLAADELSPDEAYEIAEAFLTTPFAVEERFVRRQRKIAAIEEKHLK